MARPQKVTDKQLIKAVDDYLNECEQKDIVPIIKEFALKNGISYNRLCERYQENEELSSAIKKIGSTKEIVLERGALTGKYNSTMAIFSLKQMGWRDKKEEVADNEKDTGGIIEIPVVEENE